MKPTISFLPTVTGITGYAIERTGGPGGGNQAIIGGKDEVWATSYSDQTVVAGTNYSYRVVAYNDTDRSDESNTLSVTTPDVDPNSLPYAWGTPINNTSAFISWDITSADAGMTYTVQRMTGSGGSTWTTLATGLSSQTSNFTDAGLTPGTQYYYDVIATNSAGTNTMGVPGGVITPHFQESAHNWDGNSGITLSNDWGAINGQVNAVNPVTGNVYQPDYLTVTRNSGDLDRPIKVAINLSGDGVYSKDYALIDPAGATGDGTLSVSNSGTAETAYLSFNPGETAAVIEMDPLNVGPRTGDDENMVVQAGPNYNLGAFTNNGNPIPYTAADSVAPHGLTIQLDKGEQAPIISQTLPSGATTPQGLMPLKLHIPTDLPTNSTVTLNDNSPGESLIYQWTGGTTTGGTMSGGTLTALTTTNNGSVTWTTGTGTAPPTDANGNVTLYVAAVAGTGSSTPGDTTFTLSSTPATTAANQTGQSVPTNAASVVTFNITSNYAPNYGDHTGIVTGQTINWLVGQEAQLQTQVLGPAAISIGAKPVWTIQGNPDLRIDLTKDSSQPVSFDSDPYNNFTKVVDFFWPSTSSPPGPSLENVKAGISTSVGELYASVNFDLFEPSVTADDVHANFGVDAQEVGLVTPTRYDDGFTVLAGITFNADVSTNDPPNGDAFASGSVYFLQLMNDQSDVWSWTGGVFGYGQTDTEYSAPHWAKSVKDERNIISGNGPVPTDGATLEGLELPGYTFEGRTGFWGAVDQIANSINFHEYFMTYVMYLPPGAPAKPTQGVVNNGYEVPLAVLYWGGMASGREVDGVGQRNGPDTTDIPPNFDIAKEEPSWTYTVGKFTGFNPVP